MTPPRPLIPAICPSSNPISNLPALVHNLFFSKAIPTATNMSLTLSRVVPGDFDAIIPLQFTTFAGLDVTTAFFGKPTPKNYAGAKARLLKAFETDPADLWLKIVDEDVEEEYDVLDGEGNTTRKQTTKKMVSASNWKIYPTHVAPDATMPDTATSKGVEDEEKIRMQKRDEFTWLETEQEREDGVTIFENFFARRRRACQEGHVLLFLLYVHPSY
jgi:hypothetical protein